MYANLSTGNAQGTSSGIDIIAKNTKTILNGFKKRLVVQGDIEGIKAFGIPHPSYDNSQIENEEISKVLKLSVSGKEIKPFGLKRFKAPYLLNELEKDLPAFSLEQYDLLKKVGSEAVLSEISKQIRTEEEAESSNCLMHS